MINSCINFLEKTAQRIPNKLALVDKDYSYTFSELRMNALKLANAIASKDTNRPIAVFLPKSSSSVISFMGALYTGNFYVPLDVKSPKERLEKIITDLDPLAIVTDIQSEKIVAALADNKNIKLIVIEEVLKNDQVITFDYQSRINQVVDIDPIYCIYTSGTTGSPKGVLVPHRGIIDYMDYISETYEITESSIIGSQAQFHFDISAMDLYMSMKVGATIHIIPEMFFTFTGKLVEYMDEKEIDVIYWVPSVMNHVASTDALAALKNKHLRTILFAGEVMPNKTLNYWRRHFPNALFSNLYGPTEITITCTYYNVDRVFADNEPLPIGRSCKNSNVLVLDKDNLLVSAKDTETVGELCVRGSSLALGYWRDFEKNHSSFVQNPLHSNYPDKMYRTGDLVRYNSCGEIMYIGRKDHQIKHMGYRIELGEIECAVLSLSEINNGCVFYDQDMKQIVCAYEGVSDEVTIRKKLADSLPKYMIPTYYMKLEKMPIGTTGKIDRMWVKEEYQTNQKRQE